MTQNHIPDELYPIATSVREKGLGFGLGFSVMIDNSASDILGAIGEFEWRGAYNTYFWIDPTEDLILIQMAQYSPSRYYPIHNEFKVIVYQAIVN